MGIFRRMSTLNCFYCLSLVDPRSSPTFDSTCFRCPHCGCLNRYDKHGQIISDHPAMYEEKLNQESFLKRGSPDTNHFPSTSQRASNPFCHACQTNQTLLINLRAAYLPSPDDPSYASRVAQLPAYITSLQHRYPPVCANCAPSVEAEIRKKDEYARTRALGGALKDSSRPRRRPNNNRVSENRRSESLLRWRIEGVLWALTWVATILAFGAVSLKVQFEPWQLIAFERILPPMTIASILWTFWDPTKSLRRASKVQGRQVRIEGLKTYHLTQGIAFATRLGFSLLISWSIKKKSPLCFVSSECPQRHFDRQLILGFVTLFEIFLLISSILSIRIHRPAPIRLIDSSAHRALSELASASTSTSPAPNPNAHANAFSLPEQDHFATLSLNAHPVISQPSSAGAANPMFGLSSLAPPTTINGGALKDPLDALFEPNGLQNQNDDDEDPYADDDVLSRLARPKLKPQDPDAMDWEPLESRSNSHPAPTPTSSSDPRTTLESRNKSKDDGTWLRTQRFFPPEEPTGLEGLFMRTRLVDEDDERRMRSGNGNVYVYGDVDGGRWNWGWVYSVSVVPVVGVLVGLWLWS